MRRNSVKDVKRLLRKSGECRSGFEAAFGLTALSPPMTALMNNVIRMAKQGYFVILTGHHGDLIEAPALFKEAARRLDLHDYMEIPISKKGMLYEADGYEGLFFPNSESLTIDDQLYLTNTLGNHLRLILLCFENRDGLEPNEHFLNCLLVKTDRILSWPGWQDRLEDHLPLVWAAKRFLENQEKIILNIDTEIEQFLCCTRWRSTAHLIEALLKALSNHERKTGSLVKLTMEDFLVSKGSQKTTVASIK
ncbi:hypothetical protein GF391_00615 [Candidatus Uhrbacteria bacterium]|nr:hypothetical protein [Candidatus Uhrbacteria bacterium]